MDITAEIADLNEAKAALAKSLKSEPERWAYIGDMDVREGGIAIRVDQTFRSHAEIIEVTDLARATGQVGCVLVTLGSVALDRWDRRRRQMLKSALESFGTKPSDLAKLSRVERAEQIANALWSYGVYDIDREMVIRHDGANDDDVVYPRDGSYMVPEEDVEGERGTVVALLEYLD
jgi:hypothetical protein